MLAGGGGYGCIVGRGGTCLHCQVLEGEADKGCTLSPVHMLHSTSHKFVLSFNTLFFYKEIRYQELKRLTHNMTYDPHLSTTPIATVSITSLKRLLKDISSYLFIFFSSVFIILSN